MYTQRRHQELEDTMIQDPFLNDYTKIIQAKAYRRLAFKTQVFNEPDNPHIRTRLVHTNEVVATSLAISQRLGLNSNLCLAIAAGHDIGHTPYGHVGERVLTDLTGKPFQHNVNSVVVAQHVERKGQGLNLTYATLEGILNHSRGDRELVVEGEKPQEFAAVMFADKIAYLYSDVNDAVRHGYIKEVPEFAAKLGHNQRSRTEKTIDALVEESENKGFVAFSEGPVFEGFNTLKKFMYSEVYFKIDDKLQKDILTKMYEFFSTDEEFSGVDPALLVSLVTDKEANHFGELMIKGTKIGMVDIRHFGMLEILPHLKGKEIDYTKPDLDWAN